MTALVAENASARCVSAPLPTADNAADESSGEKGRTARAWNDRNARDAFRALLERAGVDCPAEGSFTLPFRIGAKNPRVELKDRLACAATDESVLKAIDPSKLLEEQPDMNFEQGGNLMLTMDAPEHTRYRKLVNRGFTPRTVLAWEDHIQQTVNGLLDAAGAFSERAARAEAGKRPVLFNTIQTGQRVGGEVTNVTEFGVFVENHTLGCRKARPLAQDRIGHRHLADIVK